MEATDLTAARAKLREAQARWVPDPDALDLQGMARAHAHADQREEGAERDGDVIHMGGFRYDAEQELRRFEHTRRMIDRVQPGPHEDGPHLEMLCRQGASIEMFLAVEQQSQEAALILDQVLVGTIGEPRSHAWTRLVAGVPVIAISAGMMSAYYQISKAVVLAWKQTEPPEGSAVGLSPQPEDVRAVLDENPLPVEILSQTLLNWLVHGVARPDDSRPVPQEYLRASSLMINYAERFVLAHEYAHAILDRCRLPVLGFPPITVERHDKEMRADVVATLVVAESAGMLDSVGPNVALQGALIGMKVHEVVERAMVMLRGGRPLPGSETHPPFAERAALVKGVYQEAYGGTDDVRFQVAPMVLGEETVDELWRRAEPTVRAAIGSGVPLHEAWAAELAQVERRERAGRPEPDQV